MGLTFDGTYLWNNAYLNSICQLDLSGAVLSGSDSQGTDQYIDFGGGSSGACSLSDSTGESFSSIIINILVLFSPLFLLRKRTLSRQTYR